MIITIGGQAGSGKSVVAQKLVEKLGFEYVSIGNIKRALAEKMGMNIVEFNTLGDLPENQKEFDLKYEDYQKSLPLSSNIVLESRLGFFCQPNAFKVLLTVDPKIAAQRIFDNKRTTDNYGSVEEVFTITQQRNQADVERYKKLYNIDYFDPQHYRYVIDTSEKTIDQVVEDIIEHYNLFISQQQ